MYVISEKIFPRFIFCNSVKQFRHEKHGKTLTSHHALDINASSIIIGFTVLFFFFLSQSSDSSRQHLTIIANRLFTRCVELFQTQQQTAGSLESANTKRRAKIVVFISQVLKRCVPSVSDREISSATTMHASRQWHLRASEL